MAVSNAGILRGHALRLVLAATSALALGLLGCSGEASSSSGTARDGSTGLITLSLTLPDRVTIDALDYVVTGGPAGIERRGSVSLAASTMLRFRVGSLPTGAGYTLALSGTTALGEICSSSMPFSVDDAAQTNLTLTLVCGAATVGEIDHQGDLAVSTDVVIAPPQTCPIVTGINARPTDVWVGSNISLEAFVGPSQFAAESTFIWSDLNSDFGVFSNPNAAQTEFTCARAGRRFLSIEIIHPACGRRRVEDVEVTCRDPAVTCSTCLKQTCGLFQTGFDAYANCIENPDPDFRRRCTDAFLCSVQARDGCAGDLTRGPASCYCGLSDVRTIDACFAAPPFLSSTGPAGLCIPEWEAATGCAPGDNACVGQLFTDLREPSGGAYYLIQCAAQECQVYCDFPLAASPL